MARHVSNSTNGTRNTGNILDRIADAKRRRLLEARKRVPESHVRHLAESVGSPISFHKALSDRSTLAVITEMKRASPSAGSLSDTMEPEDQAVMYCNAGAAALSVLTEQDFFFGTVDDMAVAKGVSGPLGIPVLEKDFVFDDYQVYEARAFRADAVLLIMAMLEPGRYRGLLSLIHGLGMDALVEVFDEYELEAALAESPRIVGVNNRNLKTLETSLSVFDRVGRLIPKEVVAVAESGLKSVDDARRMAFAGAKAVLVGESLMKAGANAPALIREMAQIPTW